jgi:hypothetical protein
VELTETHWYCLGAETTLYISLNGLAPTKGVKHRGSKPDCGRPEASEVTHGPKWTGPYQYGWEG